MSLIDIVLQRRQKAASPFVQTFQPRFEVLEERCLLSVAAPTGLQLTALSSTQVKLAWNDVTGAIGFRIFRWDGTTISLLTQVPKSTRTFTVGNLMPNQTQWFAVEAFDNASSARGAWAAVMTPATPISAPTNVKVGSATFTQMTISWNFSGGATGYRIYAWDGARSSLVGMVGPTVNSYVINNLTAGTFYYFYVQAFNNTNSASSDWVSGSTQGYTITAPANVKTQVIGASTIGLSWDRVFSANGYRIYRWDGTSYTNPVVIATLTGTTTGYQATGLLPGQTYWFYVQSFNATNSANSAWVTARTQIALPLQPPTQMAVRIDGPNSVVLSWTEPARAVGYRVFVWMGSYWSQVSTVPAGTHQAPVTGLSTNMTNWFMVQAFTDGFAEVSYSQVVFANM